ncbi:hypothetical protein ACES2L_10845 [Bdellovibrio bacteriovorus]
MKILAQVFAFVLTIGVAVAASAGQGHKTQILWHQIPFFQGGDLGQYQITMQQDRDTVRKMLFSELMDQAQKLAESGASIEKMLVPMANILMEFDELHEKHKQIDSYKVGYSLEQQFKAEIGNLFIENDIRDYDRKLEISSGKNTLLVEETIAQIKATGFDEAKIRNMLDQIDYTAYGTFTNIGKGIFQVNIHLIGYRSGIYRSFTATGRLTQALSEVARKVFDHFQKNTYPDWENPYKKLTWMPMPVNQERAETGYSYSEAQTYCKMRGYRLPYSREILLAESGTQYKEGGIQALELYTAVPVADQRYVAMQHWLTPGHEIYTGGAVQPKDASHRGQFWCVKGEVGSDVLYIEKIFKLIREYRNTNHDVYRALETVRYFYGDFGATESFFSGTKLLRIYENEDQALAVLKKNGIKL